MADAFLNELKRHIDKCKSENRTRQYVSQMQMGAYLNARADRIVALVAAVDDALTITESNDWAFVLNQLREARAALDKENP